MKYYIEITLPSDSEDLFNLWSKLLTQIHLGLVSIQDEKEKSPIGVSFPEYFMGEKFGVIGSKLRLFAQNESDLIKFDSAKWLSRLSDYVHITSIREVPQKIDGYAIYNRHQPKVNKERLARRYAKRHNLDYETAMNGEVELSVRSNNGEIEKKLLRYCDLPNKVVGVPFIKLKSFSSKNEFCLWIKKTTTNESNYQKFSTYGLSKISTVPEF